MKAIPYLILALRLAAICGASPEDIPKDKKPAPIKMEPPAYPEELRKKRVSGVVEVEFIIQKDGTVKSVKATKSPDERLSVLAEEAVSKWIFEPGIKNGEPVEVRIRVPVTFSTKNQK